jgi:transmembrane sensor
MSDTRALASTSIATEAADWYARLRAQDVSQLEAVRFRAWLAGDPARRREFEAIDTFWDNLSAIEKSPEVLRVRAELAARRRRKRKGRTGAWWAVAATIVIAMAGVWTAWLWSADRYATNVGEQRTVPLPDGSLITLNTDTEVRLHYSKAKRAVELIRGQANFEVAKDASRPFVVAAGGGEVQAVGTVFDVYKSADKVTVTLIEGKVAVIPQASPGLRPPPYPHPNPSPSEGEGAIASSPSPSHGEGQGVRNASGKGGTAIYLSAGEQLSYATTAGSVKRVSADVPRVTAWRARKLDFSNTPILEAIAEANRYSLEQIVLEAPELKDARISGTFEAGKNDLFAEGLQTFFSLDVVRSPDNRIVLKSMPE